MVGTYVNTVGAYRSSLYTVAALSFRPPSKSENYDDSYLATAVACRLLTCPSPVSSCRKYSSSCVCAYSSMMLPYVTLNAPPVSLAVFPSKVTNLSNLPHITQPKCEQTNSVEYFLGAQPPHGMSKDLGINKAGGHSTTPCGIYGGALIANIVRRFVRYR